MLHTLIEEQNADLNEKKIKISAKEQQFVAKRTWVVLQTHLNQKVSNLD